MDQDLTQEEIVLAGIEGADDLGRSRRFPRGRGRGLQNRVRNEMGASRFRKHFLESPQITTGYSKELGRFQSRH